MLSLIEVRCPHCGAHGQIMLPPVGTIIVGPCPECQGLVVVFCGHVLALDKEIMLNGSVVEKRDHMMAVLTPFLRDRISQMLGEGTDENGEAPAEEPSAPESHPADEGQSTATAEKPPLRPISKDEVKSFVNGELRLLDNSDYFKAIFG